MQLRYLKNIGTTFSESDQNILLTKTIGVLGAGGNGGYVIEFLCRLGVKKLIIFDGDKFEESNLNRQIYCNKDTIGKNKAEAAFEMCQKINPDLNVEAFSSYAGMNYQEDLQALKECDIIFYESDPYVNIHSLRTMLKELLVKYNIPIVEGGVQDIGGFCSIVTKENVEYFEQLTQNFINQPSIITISQPAYLCAHIACQKVNTVVKYFCSKKYSAENEELFFDMIHDQIHRQDKFNVIY